jgi:hypothetical protein
MNKKYLSYWDAHCSSGNCPKRLKCLRWLSAENLMRDGNQIFVPWFAPNPEDCTHFIEAIDA